MATGDKDRGANAQKYAPLEPDAFADALVASVKRLPPAGVQEDVNGPPATACDSIRQLMATKLQEWNRYRTLVFIVLAAGGAVLVVAIILTIVSTTRAAGITTGVTNIVVDGGLVALLLNERNKAGTLADKYVNQYKKHGCG